MPAIGTMAGTECGSPVTLVRTNNGCMNNNFSIPFPVDNYQGAGSATGTLPTIVIVPTWTQTTQSLFSASRPKPWIYYDGALDPDSPRFLQDYVYCPDRAFIQSQMADALDGVRADFDGSGRPAKDFQKKSSAAGFFTKFEFRTRAPAPKQTTMGKYSWLDKPFTNNTLPMAPPPSPDKRAFRNQIINTMNHVERGWDFFDKY